MSTEHASRHPVLASVWAKLDRADRHRAELNAVLSAELPQAPHVWRHDYVAESDVFVVRLDQPPSIPGSVGAVLSDLIHNLRSALDYLVYKLAVVESHLDPPPGASTLAFPVSLTPEEFKMISKRKRGPIGDSAWSVIERYQPYRTHPEDFHGNSFWVLQQLDDFGKHRDFPLATTAVGETMKLSPPADGFEVHGLHDVGPLVKNSQLLTYRTPNRDLRLGFEVDYALWFAKGEPFPDGFPVYKALDALRADVEVVVTSFAFTERT